MAKSKFPSGHRPWQDLRDDLAERHGPEHIERVAAVRQAMEDAIRLADLRDEVGATQATVAGALGVSRARISALEKQRDLYLSTLREYVEALGGRLEVTAVFDGHRHVLIGEAESV